MTLKVKKGPKGVKVLNTPGQINPIERDPHDNTTDLEMKGFAAQSRRKFNAPANTGIPGTQTTAPPTKTTSLPSG